MAKKTTKVSKKAPVKKAPARKAPKRTVKHSSEAIELSYAEEKKKIDRSLDDLERERLRGHIELLNKRKAIVQIKKQKLEELERSISSHANAVKSQISRLKKNKTGEKGEFDHLFTLNEHLKRMESQVRDVTISRRATLKKENELLREIKIFFKKNRHSLERYGSKNITHINQVLDKKTRILADAAHILNEDVHELGKDKSILEKLTDAQLNKVYALNEKLKKLEDEAKSLHVKKQTLRSEDFDYDHAIDEIERKKGDLKDELADLLR